MIDQIFNKKSIYQLFFFIVLHQIAPLHLSCQRGHVEIVRLLLAWNADVTFRSAGGRNGLDYAIDYMQKECVMALLKHPSWQDSMKNYVTDQRTGQFPYFMILVRDLFYLDGYICVMRNLSLLLSSGGCPDSRCEAFCLSIVCVAQMMRCFFSYLTNRNSHY